MPRSIHWLLGVFGLCSLVEGPVARSAGESTRRVELVFAGNDEAKRIDKTLTETLSSLGVETHFQTTESIDPHQVSRPMPPDPAIVARLWLDCRAPDHVTLYLATPDASRIYVRDLALEHKLDPVALELLSLVARNSVSALLAGGQLGVPRAEYEKNLPVTEVSAPTSTPTPAPPPPNVSVFHLAAYYEVEMLGPTAFEHGPGAQLEWESQWIVLGLAAQARVPLDVGSGPFRVRFDCRTVRGVAAHPLRISKTTSMLLGTAFGIDWIEVSPQATESDAEALRPFSAFDPAVRSFVSIRHVFREIELGALAGAEWGLVDANYVLTRAGVSETVFSPWRLRPLASLSFGVHW